MGVSGQRHALAALPPPPLRERDPVPTLQEAEWAPGPVWAGFDPWTVQAVASCYNDYTIPAHIYHYYNTNTELLYCILSHF
jgi:hypothetical protein